MATWKKYSSYTLMEMLVVMAIFIILALIGFASFRGLKETIALNEQTLNLSQDIRMVQRAAMFLERNANERWIYGIGIDFSDLGSEKTYRLFKWCSQYDSFGSARTRSELPNYDEAFAVGGVNGNLPNSLNYVYKDCEIGVADSELVLFTGETAYELEKNFVITFPASNNGIGDVGGIPMYLLFEAVSGRAFFYDDQGMIVNYTSEGEIISNPIDLVFEVFSPNTRVKKTITIDNVSGKLLIESESV